MSERNDMTCAELADVAAELALGVLTGRERAMAVAHLEGCDACREDVRQLMATGEQLIELLPPAEPPAGFETRVLSRIGLAVPAEEEEETGLELPPAEPPAGFETRVLERLGLSAQPAPAKEESPGDEAYPQVIQRRGGSHERRGSARDGARPGGNRSRGGRRGADHPSAPPPGPGGPRRPGRLRRALAATAVGLAVIAAGLGGWRVGVGSAPAASSAAGSLTSASLVSATHQNVGDVFVHSGASQWLYMSVDLGAGNEVVTCQLVGKDGRVTAVGTFRLAGGYGAWGSPAWGNIGPLAGARLVSTNGTVVASAAFTVK